MPTLISCKCPSSQLTNRSPSPTCVVVLLIQLEGPKMTTNELYDAEGICLLMVTFYVITSYLDTKLCLEEFFALKRNCPWLGFGHHDPTQFQIKEAHFPQNTCPQMWAILYRKPFCRFLGNFIASSACYGTKHVGLELIFFLRFGVENSGKSAKAWG